MKWMIVLAVVIAIVAVVGAGIKLLRWQGRDMADEATIRDTLFPTPVAVPRPHAEDARKSAVGGAQRGAG